MPVSAVNLLSWRRECPPRSREISQFAKRLAKCQPSCPQIVLQVEAELCPSAAALAQSLRRALSKRRRPRESPIPDLIVGAPGHRDAKRRSSKRLCAVDTHSVAPRTTCHVIPGLAARQSCEGVGTRFSKRSGHASMPPPPKNWLSLVLASEFNFLRRPPSDLRYASKSGHALALQYLSLRAQAV